MSTMSSSTVVAASVAPYVSDNFTAKAASSAFQIPEGSVAGFTAWKEANANVQWYTKKEGSTVSFVGLNANEEKPSDAVPVGDSELHIVYASLEASLHQSLVDWAMARAQDELLQKTSYASVNNVLTQIPEVDVNADLSSLSQSELLQLLKQLVGISQSLKMENALGDAKDLQSKALQLGLSVDLLAQGLELQATFAADSAAPIAFDDAASTAKNEAVTISVLGNDADVSPNSDALVAGSVKITSQPTNGSVVVNNDGTVTYTPNPDYQGPDSFTYTVEDDDGVVSNEASVNLTVSATSPDSTQSSTNATGSNTALNDLFAKAINEMVGEYQSNVAAAKLAYSEAAASSLSQKQLADLTSTAFRTLIKSLSSSADLGFLATSAELKFGIVQETLQTRDGFVLNTAASASREAQTESVEAQLRQALSDPGLKSNFMDALAATADNLGTADLALPLQTQLYQELADAIVKTIVEDPNLLNDIASEAVDSGTRFFDMLGNELEGASKKENAEQQQFS
jgi:hypothetical protein